VFERVRHDIGVRPPGQVRHVIVDFAMVTGADASAPFSLAKLRHFCERQGATLVLSSLGPVLRRALERQGVVAPDGPAPFDDVNAALAWCEDRLLEAARVGATVDGVPGFESWLQQQLGPAVRAADFMAYLERRDVSTAQVLYRQGEASDQIDLVAGGRLCVDVDRGNGQTMRVRSITTHTVVGEMGFFRRAARSATVSSDGPATLYTLTREAFERLRRERPDLAGAFDDFLIRTLSERIVLSERMIGALGR
jgi:SulP family sulfate permease